MSSSPRSIPKAAGETQAEKYIFAPGTSDQPTRAAQFTKSALSRALLNPSPITLFNDWFKHAQSSGIAVPETCTLSTASLPSGRVSARVVYLKELSPAGFVVYSNWGTSRKAADLASNPHAALTFHWASLERQVRVEGRFERLTQAESQRYFDTRERGSRLGAWTSAQSSVLRDREELEQRLQDVEARFDGIEDIPVPEFWGGGRIIPDEVEFWQGRPSRLHDRFRYTRSASDLTTEASADDSRDDVEEAKLDQSTNDQGWTIVRLSP
ncbi:MAG: hypothetical protein M1825_005723 [Sarcosagium campestre]|nr:MAG: hypothetical protein M1825_005723 [Sarcosagium campestre]